MIRNILPILVLMCLMACANKTSETKTYSSGEKSEGYGYFTPQGDSVIIPAFEVDIKLSPKAEQKLKSDRETVIVSAMFSGIPKDTTSEAYLMMGQTDIVTHDVELMDQRTARFESIKFAKSVFDGLADKDINLLINVFSGRRSSGDNLLDVGILEDKMSRIKGGKFTLTGKLIYGDDE